MAEKGRVNTGSSKITRRRLYPKKGPPSDTSEAYSGSDFGEDLQDNGNKGNPKKTTPEPVSNTPSIPMSSLPSTSTADATNYLEVNSVVKLGSPRFTNPAVGSTLKLRLLKQNHFQASSKPLFELAELSEHYEKMAEEMSQFYLTFPSNSKPVLQPTQIFQGCYAVLKYVESNAVHRIKFLTKPLKDCVRIEMIDCYVKKTVDVGSCFLFLHEDFAKLPPRVAAIDMDGMSHYLNHNLFRQFVTHNSEQFLFEGELTATVQPNGKVVVYSDAIPKKEFLHGINECITIKFIQQLQEPKLPLLGHRGDVFVVYSKDNGVISLQMTSVVGSHYREIFNSISPDSISRLKGTVKELSDQSKNEDLYFAPSQLDGTYYRSRILSQVDGEKVHVSFIDYGDETTVNISELVPCRNLHPLMAVFPPQCVKVRLENIQTLKARKYFKKYHSFETPNIVQVVKTEIGAALAEVVLWPKEGEIGKSINEEIMDNKLGNPTNPTFKPETPKSYSESFSCMYSLYLALSGGKRLQPAMDLEVRVSHHESMSNMFFITPISHRSRLEELEKDIDKDYNLPWNKKVRPEFCTKGEAMVCYSKILEKVARALLVEPVSQHILHEDDEDEEELPLGSYWKVYLIDYGIFEVIPTKNFRMILPRFIKPPAFGIRVWCKSTSSNDILRLSLCRTVTVAVQLVRKDPFGEIAEIMVEGLEEFHPKSMSRVKEDEDEKHVSGE